MGGIAGEKEQEMAMRIEPEQRHSLRVRHRFHSDGQNATTYEPVEVDQRSPLQIENQRLFLQL